MCTGTGSIATGGGELRCSSRSHIAPQAKRCGYFVWCLCFELEPAKVRAYARMHRCVNCPTRAPFETEKAYSVHKKRCDVLQQAVAHSRTAQSEQRQHAEQAPGTAFLPHLACWPCREPEIRAGGGRLSLSLVIADAGPVHSAAAGVGDHSSAAGSVGDAASNGPESAPPSAHDAAMAASAAALGHIDRGEEEEANYQAAVAMLRMVATNGGFTDATKGAACVRWCRGNHEPRTNHDGPRRLCRIR